MSRFQTPTPVSLSRKTSIEASADIYEYSPWVAERVYDLGIDDSLNDIGGPHQRMADILLSASRGVQLMLINAHPDLVGKAATRGEPTTSSTSEQIGAGIYEYSTEEFARLIELNDTYRVRLGFPFTKTVKGSNRHQILMAFGGRIQYFVDERFATTLAEANEIALLRL